MSPTASSASTLRASWVPPFGPPGPFGLFGSRRARSSARLARSSASASVGWSGVGSGALSEPQSPAWLRARTQSDAVALRPRGLGLAAPSKALAASAASVPVGSANLAFADGDAALQDGTGGRADPHDGALLDLSEVVHVVEEQGGIGHKE